jgi:hypothetical protein
MRFGNASPSSVAIGTHHLPSGEWRNRHDVNADLKLKAREHAIDHTAVAPPARERNGALLTWARTHKSN